LGALPPCRPRGASAEELKIIDVFICKLRKKIAAAAAGASTGPSRCRRLFWMLSTWCTASERLRRARTGTASSEMVREHYADESDAPV
jgi:hypothetical protein